MDISTPAATMETVTTPAATAARDVPMGTGVVVVFVVVGLLLVLALCFDDDDDDDDDASDVWRRHEAKDG